jgi:hypothetical protein
MVVTASRDTEEMTVSIFDGHCRVELVPTGDPEPGYPASSYHTRMNVRSVLSRRASKLSLKTTPFFLSALSRLHGSMEGEARLEFWNEEHAIILKGSGNGRIEVDVRITDGRSPWRACLRISMVLDQSFLPGIISALNEEFPV